jgi:DNA helicase-2/ATP-dependent DNA helicase PcrA
MKKYYLSNKSKSNFCVDYSKELNPEQYEVVMHHGGPMLILAGAGTGKTRTIIYRVARLIDTGTKPDNILLITFTNKAANDMMKKAEDLMKKYIYGLWGGTFHHIANIILRKHAQLIGYKEGFSILDKEDSKELLDSCLDELTGKKTLMPKGNVLCEISSLLKNKLVPLEDLILQRYSHFINAIDEIRDVLKIYEKKKRRLNLMDFDDLLFNWKRLLLEHEKIRNYYSDKFEHVLVDEYQDTNKIQAEIVDLICFQHRNITAVGDDAQSIYSFRGAEFENIIRFPERYPDVKIFNLTINYRSTPEILNLANKSIINNVKQFQKKLQSVKSSGEPPYLVRVNDIIQQAEFVAQRILELNEDNIPLNEIAILYRSHYQSMELQMELQSRGIPFEVRSGLKFFEQAHIKDILSFLRIITNPYDELSWKRVLKLIPGIGKKTVSKLWDNMIKSNNPIDCIFELDYIIQQKAIKGFSSFLNLLNQLREVNMPSDAIELVLRNGYEDHLYNHYPDAEDRLEDIMQMLRYSKRYDSLEKFTSDLSLQSASGFDIEEDENGDKDYVILSTVHQAKGLEWDVVFIIGLNDGKFPSEKSLRNNFEEEERRLFYVAITRARKNLYLCCPESDDNGGFKFQKQSRFLKELPDYLYEELIVERDRELR